MCVTSASALSSLPAPAAKAKRHLPPKGRRTCGGPWGKRARWTWTRATRQAGTAGASPSHPAPPRRSRRLCGRSSRRRAKSSAEDATTPVPLALQTSLGGIERGPGACYFWSARPPLCLGSNGEAVAAAAAKDRLCKDIRGSPTILDQTFPCAPGRGRRGPCRPTPTVACAAGALFVRVDSGRPGVRALPHISKCAAAESRAAARPTPHFPRPDGESRGHCSRFQPALA